MRPFTEVVFTHEGKSIVGSRWTIEQVRQAYEKADDLLDYIAEYKALKPVQELGLDKIHPGFEEGLAVRVTKKLPDEAVQSLSLGTLIKLLTRGEQVLKFAAYTYKHTPDDFRAHYASSKQAAFKDRFLFRPVPVFSFSPFKTGDNPAIIQDEKLSRTCANLYHDAIRTGYPLSQPDNIPINYTLWTHFGAGDKFFNETVWLRTISQSVRWKKLERTAPVASIIGPKEQHTL